MKYAFYQRYRRVWPISVQCRVLRVSVAGYHEHWVRRRGEVRRRHLSDEGLLVHIRAVYADESRSLRLAEDLETTAGSGHSRGQAADTTADAAARHSRPRQAPFRSRLRTADMACRLYRTGWMVTSPWLKPNQVWVGDITYIPTDEGWLFLAVVSGPVQPPGGGLVAGGEEHKRCEFVIDALRDGLVHRQPIPGGKTGLIFHSDRGSQYASVPFRRPPQNARHHGFDESQRRLLG